MQDFDDIIFHSLKYYSIFEHIHSYFITYLNLFVLNIIIVTFILASHQIQLISGMMSM
jgi:hypothetical protein